MSNALLRLALHGTGYNNWSPTSTGEHLFLKLLAEYEPQLCVDVGANNGQYSEALLNLTDSKLIAFEPLPKAFESLVKLQSRFPDRLVAINKGVGDQNTEMVLHFGEADSELASFSEEASQIDYVGQQNKKIVMVEVTTLDAFFETSKNLLPSQIDLLKIDTEGFEYEVLAGAKNTIERRKPKFIQIEYNWHQLFKAQSLFKLASLLPNYTPYKILPFGSGLTPVDVRRPENNIYCYSNFVFVRGDLSIV